MTEGIFSISGKNLSKQEKRLLIGATYANARSWDIRRKKRPRLFDRVHKDSKWQKLFSRGHYNDYWFIYLWGSFVETISLFTGRRKRRGGDGLGLDLWVELCTPPKYWHSTSPVQLVETKVLNPCSKHWHSSLLVLLPNPLWSVPGPPRLLWIVCISTPWWLLFRETLWMAEVFKP